MVSFVYFFFQAEDGIRDLYVTGVQTCALPISLTFSFPGGQFPPFDGEMVEFEPQSVMEIRWGPDTVRLELRPIDEGTELTLLDTLEERGKAARDGAGWHTCLDALERSLGGDADARDQMNGWKDVHEHYVESFGPEAATIGPPEGI